MASMMSTSLAKTERCTAGRNTSSVIAAPDELIAHATDGLDEGGMPRVVAELLAQAADQHVHRAVESLPVEAAGGLHDPLPAEHAAAAADEQAEQLELGRRQLEAPPLQPRRPAGPVDLERPAA